ncbi:MAG TPA: GNAT family N-acetyltransferase, partial [Ktedonobacterales bacterium]|nr:GNAT family N-acetyltransferase [Ktedonobacterales bacterium]
QAASVSHEEYIAAYCESVRAELEQGRFLAWLAEADGQPVACTVLIWWQMPPNLEHLHRCRGYVSSVYTHPDYRRRGLARTLMEKLIAQARELGITNLVLNASRMGRPLYESLGFVVPERGMELHLFKGA